MARKKGPPHWLRRFLRALGWSGNVRFSASVAGVDHGTPYAYAKRHPPFDRAWKRMVGIAQRRMVADAAAGRAEAAAQELVVRRSKRCGTQLVRAARGRWSLRKQRRFLAWLERTGNVRRAARAAGISTTALYERRAKYARFRADWDEALARATPSLRSFVVAAAIATFDPESAADDDADEPPLPTVTVAEAIAILRLDGTGGGDRAGRPPSALRYGPPPPTIEQVRESILRRLDAIEAHARKQRGQR